MKKRELEDWEMAECVALKKAIDTFNAGKPRKDRVSQGDIADALSINQGSVSSYLNGVNALNAKAAGIIAGMIGIPVESFSPRLAKEIALMAHSVSRSAARSTPESTAEDQGTSMVAPVVVRVIAGALASGQLTASDGEELHRIALHLISKNAAATGAVEIPAHLEGLAEAALRAAEQGNNAEDLLKMVGHGLNKSQPKEGTQKDGKRKASRS